MSDDPGATAAPRRPFGSVDAPVDGSVETGGIIEVLGWAAGVAEVDRIEVSLDDGEPELARTCCFPRPDVVAHTGDRRDLLSGFWHAIDLAGRPEGSRCRVRVDACGPGGSVTLASREVVVGAVATLLDPPTRDWVSALAGRAQMVADSCVPGDGLGLFVVTHDLELGGAQLWLQEILRRVLREHDCSCTVVAHTDGPLRSELEELGARVHLRGRLPFVAGEYESAVRELLSLVSSERPNVVVVNTSAAFVGVDVALRCGLPSVYAIHEHFPENVLWYHAAGRPGLDEHLRERARVALGEASVACFVTEATRRLFVPSDDERALVIDYGVPPAEPAPGPARRDLRSSYGFLPGDKVLVCVAVFDSRKGQASLLAAFSSVAGRYPDAHLVLVGARDDRYSCAVTELAAALGLERRVRILPVTPEVESWWAIADAMVLASDSESLPRSIMEAMTRGVPVLATDVGGVGELVRDGATGLLVPPRDIGALASGLDRLLSAAPDELAAMAARARNALGARRDVVQYVDTFVRLLRGLAKDPGASPRRLVEGG